MSPAGSDIDRLIEEGLDRYGAGDLDGALLAWERVLTLDPNNEQAHSYVEYVRMNYELIAEAGVAVGTEDNEFALGDEPEYSIEIVPGELAEGAPGKAHVSATEEGWLMSDEVGGSLRPPEAVPTGDTVRAPDAGPAIELEAEPPARDSDTEFDTATREYGADRLEASGFAAPEPATNEFAHEEATDGFTGAPGGFASETTELRQRELGFVRPTIPPRTEAAGVAQVGGEDTAAIVGAAPTIELPIVRIRPSDPPANELARSEPSGSEPPRTKPLASVPPSSDPAAKLPRAMSEPYAELELAPVATSTPTLDLGLRTRPVTETDELPTRENDARAFRTQAAERASRVTTERGIGQSRASTDSQVVTLLFDPIEARAKEILDYVDREAPPTEVPEDRTRRRLTSLFEYAHAYDSMGDHERAVAAAELALSEDPESAVAQKLIHRNRDAIMGVFQSYLGDLQRQPQLARPLHELAEQPIGPRAAFLLSRVDGTLTIDETLDVSGMPRIEAYRYLCQLFMRGILK